MNEKKQFETKTNLPIFKTHQTVQNRSNSIKYFSKTFKTLEKTTFLGRKRNIKFLTKKLPYFKIESFSRKKERI